MATGLSKDIRGVIQRLPGGNVVLEPWMEKLVSVIEVERDAINQAIIKGELERQKSYYAHVVKIGFGRETFVIAENTRIFVTSFIPNPVVYYFGIGSPKVRHIDIIAPLLMTDFSLLLGSDIETCSFECFEQQVRENLAVVSSIDPLTLHFIEKPSYYEARFQYREKWRSVVYLFNFNAETRVPHVSFIPDFNILFTRRTGELFAKMTTGVKIALLGALPENGFLIVDTHALTASLKKRYLPSCHFLHVDISSAFGLGYSYRSSLKQLILYLKHKKP